MAEEEVVYEDMTVEELKDELTNRGLATSGNKAELIARLDEDDAAQNGGEVPEPVDVEGTQAAVGEATDSLVQAQESFEITRIELEDAHREQQLALAEASAAARTENAHNQAEEQAQREIEKEAARVAKDEERAAHAAEQREKEAQREAGEEEEEVA